MSLSFGTLSTAGSIVTSNCTFTEFDLGGTYVKGELQIGAGGQKNFWMGTSSINLRNVKAGSLSDGGKDSWPDELNLDGFVYLGLGEGARGHISRDDIANRPGKWFVGWMSRQKPYSAQPYFQLAALFKKMGFANKANQTLYSSKEQERQIAQNEGQRWRWLGLTMLNLTIGYGYGHRYFRSLIWVLALLIIGILVVGTVTEGYMASASFLDRVGFSLDKLVPVVELNDKYKLDFHGWQLAYFYIHKILGIVLTSFVAAGLTGVTKNDAGAASLE